MTESRVGFLYNAASSFLSTNNRSHNLLRSYYLMRCNQISSAVLPEKYFSSKIRCPNCFIEWSKETEFKIRSRKLSKQQRRRLRQKGNNNPSFLKQLLHNKELDQICSFCKHSTTTPLTKVEKKNKTRQISVIKENSSSQENSKITTSKTESKPVKAVPKIPAINVYANAKDIFSMKNNDNNLPNTEKETLKIIKNNKKKKDKFAGLCQQAVLASAKLKEGQKTQNKLNLFLKPST